MNYLVDFRVANVGGAVTRGVVIPDAGLGTEFDLRRESSIAFLVHGFNVNRSSGTDAFRQLLQHLPLLGGMAYVGMLWPGDHWSRAASYSFEGNDADDSATALTTFIGDTVTRGTELSFVSHSLGARVVLEAIKRLKRTDYPTRQVCLMAAAIDDFSLAAQRTYLTAVARTQRVAVLASREDRVLKLAYPLGDFLQSLIFFRTDRTGLALGFHGPRPHGGAAVPPVVIHEQIPDGRQSDHGHYFPQQSATGVTRANQLSAVAYAADVLRGAAQPRYT
jgi:esterase/lipase superfamily enzyme